MNILAHAYLSGPRSVGSRSVGQRSVGSRPADHHSELVIGNFIGDFIKGDPAGPRHTLMPGEVAGVRLHRAIDTFTDAHPDVAAVRNLLHPRCHKYAGAAVDIFLIISWRFIFWRLQLSRWPNLFQISTRRCRITSHGCPRWRLAWLIT